MFDRLPNCQDSHREKREPRERIQTIEGGAERASILPLAQVRRVALLLPEPSSDYMVQRAVAAERANHAGRRRPGLFAPKPTARPARPASLARSAPSKPPAAKAQSANKAAGPKQPSVEAPQPDTPDYTPAQLRAITEALFWDALAERLDRHLEPQVVPQSEMLEALKELHLSPSTAPTGARLAELCGKLNCEAVLVPGRCQIRTREADIRALSLWFSVRIIRPGSGQSPPGADRQRAPNGIDYPIAGASYSETAPFQDRFFKDWPQIAGEAARQAADVAGHTLATGIVAPFVGERDRVAIAPVPAPRQADALMFRPSGRTVVPAALRQMPAGPLRLFSPGPASAVPGCHRIVQAGRKRAASGEPPRRGPLDAERDAGRHARRGPWQAAEGRLCADGERVGFASRNLGHPAHVRRAARGPSRGDRRDAGERDGRSDRRSRAGVGRHGALVRAHHPQR